MTKVSNMLTNGPHHLDDVMVFGHGLTYTGYWVYAEIVTKVQ